MERETKIITTPVDGHKVELKSYIIGRELEEIDDVLYEEMKMSAIVEGQKRGANIDFNNARFIRKQLHKAIEILVVSVDGSKENVLDKVLNMKKDDYLFVVNEIDKITGNKEDGSPELKKKEQ